MNKTLKGIIGGSILLAMLGGVFAYLKLTEPEPAENSSSQSADSGIQTELFNAYSDDINQIEVKNPNGDSYIAVRRIDQTKTTDAEGNEKTEDIANYYLKGYEKLPMNTTQIRLLATRAGSVTSEDTVAEDVPDADLAKYGLDQPVEVTLSVDNSEPIKFRIGDETPVGGNRYVAMDGSNTVYTLGSFNVEPYLDGIKDYLGTELTKEQADDDKTKIESVRIERKDLDYDFYFIYDPYYEENANGGAMALHVMEEPVKALLSGDRSAEATHGLYGLNASEVLTPFPKDADKKAAGLDDPFVKVTMKTDDHKTTEFILGDTYQTEDGETRYYGMLKGIDCIYGFAPDQIAYEDLKAEDIISRNVIDMYVWDIGKLTVEGGGEKLSFTVQGESKEDAVVTFDGKKQDEEGIERYRKFYSYLLNTKAEDLVMPDEDVKLSGDPLATVKIDRQDGKRSYDIQFYDAGNMKAYIVVDGEARFRCRKSYVDTLISNMKIYNDADKEFTMSW
ncbi:MAG: DUF4340 domain-containing protein [Oscillospiraceae bacterium]|nr:DUF4340 domain-containing protein [Oscillospiraceae bacterium]